MKKTKRVYKQKPLTQKSCVCKTCHKSFVWHKSKTDECYWCDPNGRKKWSAPQRKASKSSLK